MSYVVLALKWRPKTFDEIIGQDRAVSTLKSAIQKNRLAHAYLFSGPRGVGKTSCARILARALNCQDGPTAAPCGQCPACRDIAAGRSLDVIEIDGASNRGIDEIRTLRENVKFSPVNGKFKVYIIDEVHQITTDGFNALLKTLEEPPEFVKFIFATTQPQKVPPTILSRCQRLDFRRISVMEMIKQLEKISAAEKIKVDSQVLAAIARASDGALRDAESILDQLISFSRDKVAMEDVVSMLGMVEQSALFDIADKVIAKDPKAALNLLNDIIDKGKDPAVLLNELIGHFRNLMIAKVSQGDPRLIDLPQETCEALLVQAGKISLEEIFNAFNVLAGTQEMAKRFESLRIPLEISFIRLTRATPPRQAIEPKPRPVVPEEKKAPLKEKYVPAGPKVFVAKEKPAAPDPKPEVAHNKPDNVPNRISLEQVKEVWQNVIEAVTRAKISVGTYLNEGLPMRLENGVLTISFAREHSLHRDSLERKDNRDLIEKIIAGLLHGHIRLDFILSKEEKPEHRAENNTVVRSALDMFNGRLIREG
ncbi:MAG: DNA polymerase III subunit gamma/tau [Candidatus Omnitrophica bacterium]|nr:DNA polymerase III subunit gamma/tau [Candidatus Omnitrophota bacterium]